MSMLSAEAGARARTMRARASRAIDEAPSRTRPRFSGTMSFYLRVASIFDADGRG